MPHNPIVTNTRKKERDNDKVDIAFLSEVDRGDAAAWRCSPQGKASKGSPIQRDVVNIERADVPKQRKGEDPGG